MPLPTNAAAARFVMQLLGMQALGHAKLSYQVHKSLESTSLLDPSQAAGLHQHKIFPSRSAA